MDIRSVLTDAITRHLSDDGDPRNRALLAILTFCDIPALEVIARELNVGIPFEHAVTLGRDT